MLNRQELVENIQEMTTMIITEDLPKALESLNLLSNMLPPWSPKAEFELPLREVLEESLSRPFEPVESNLFLHPLTRKILQKIKKEAEISRPLYY